MVFLNNICYLSHELEANNNNNNNNNNKNNKIKF